MKIDDDEWRLKAPLRRASNAEALTAMEGAYDEGEGESDEFIALKILLEMKLKFGANENEIH